MLNKREVALETIHGMLQQIQDAESHKKAIALLFFHRNLSLHIHPSINLTGIFFQTLIFVKNFFNCYSIFSVKHQILDAYKAGAAAFKERATKYNLTTDNIDDVLSDVQEVS